MDDRRAIRVVVCDDHLLVQEGVAHVLREAGLDVVGTASDADELMRVTESLRPDVVVTDIRMPPTSTGDGLEAAKLIRSAWPGTGVVVLSQYYEAEYALALLRHGTDRVGYLLKDRVGDRAAFADAVRRVALGGSAIDPEVVRRMIDRPRLDSPIDTLTDRERLVLKLMAEGLSNQGIADELVVSVAAVEHHVTNIFLKLGLAPTTSDHRRVLAVLEYVRHG
ncbi:MAG TPA: response regulator transcription factor [Acidimicrobiales bacterium]|nr:response regulator transcription factor [Acidimicrobiales bacterium]